MCLLRGGEFVFPINFVVLDTEKVPNVESYIPIILGHHFLATSNTLVNYRNGMTKLFFGNMTLDLNIFHL